MPTPGHHMHSSNDIDNDNSNDNYEGKHIYIYIQSICPLLAYLHVCIHRYKHTVLLMHIYYLLMRAYQLNEDHQGFHQKFNTQHTILNLTVSRNMYLF